MDTERPVENGFLSCFADSPTSGRRSNSPLSSSPSGRNSPQWNGVTLDPSYAPKVLKGNSYLARVESEASSEVKVLVIYTGGTIGMGPSDAGYIPQTNVLEKTIAKFPQLNDVEYAVSHFGQSEKRPLVLPQTGEPFRILYSVFEYEPLLDSSNMTMDDWVRIALDIRRHYEKFDGFVILHGTDTMAYTASALSFMLENLGKPVVITGSQIPLFEPRSDGRDNLLNSLIISGNYAIPEVVVLFNNRVYRGNRTSKVSATSLRAFDSPNMTPLARIGIKIQVDWANVYRSPNIERFSVHSTLNRNVGLLRLFPSITVEVVRAFLTPPVQGVVMQTYGSGNGPSNRRDLLDELKRASQRGVIIVNCTQCATGKVESNYETGSALSECGVIPGSDMTPEAALTKLSYVLSKTEWSLATKRLMMQTNIRGELTVTKDVKLEDMDLITAVMKTMRLSTSEEVTALRDALYPVILCTLASKGDLEKLEIMRQFGAYLSAYDYDFRTPLHVSCSEGNLAVTKYLLEHGASVHMRDREFKTPLMNAIENDRHDVIVLLKKAGSHIVLPPVHIAEMLISAVRSADLKRLQSFLLAGVSLNECDGSSRTPLHAAVEMNQETTARFLLVNGADRSLRDVYGRTPAETASALGRDALRILIEQHQPKSTDTKLVDEGAIKLNGYEQNGTSGGVLED